MSTNATPARLGATAFVAAAFVLGLLAGPQTIGVATADTPGSTVASADSSAGVSRSARAARPGVAAANSVAGSRTAYSQAPTPKRARAAAAAQPAAGIVPDRRIGAGQAGSVATQVPAGVRTSLAGGAPAAVAAPAIAVPPLDPTSTVSTPYGQLGQWMINKSGNIADWVGIPQDGKTILEGINIVVVDSASANPIQAKRNLNAWMRQAGFGASAFSSTGYQGVLGTTTYGQQPAGPSQAFRNAYFFLSNSHGRVFGPYLNPDGPGYLWIASLSKENLDLKNFSHGYDSFQVARADLVAGMLGAGAQDLGTIFMDNVYNVGDFSTGDANGYATVLGINTVLKTAKAPRGATKAKN
ncbi:MAG: hypothetical protein KDB71_14605 [Mycobacterium sp.]|nr:hypothetical protein [Mycobacterium sp.]